MPSALLIHSIYTRRPKYLCEQKNSPVQERLLKVRWIVVHDHVSRRDRAAIFEIPAIDARASFQLKFHLFSQLRPLQMPRRVLRVISFHGRVYWQRGRRTTSHPLLLRRRTCSGIVHARPTRTASGENGRAMHCRKFSFPSFEAMLDHHSMIVGLSCVPRETCPTKESLLGKACQTGVGH